MLSGFFSNHSISVLYRGRGAGFRLVGIVEIEFSMSVYFLRGQTSSGTLLRIAEMKL